LQVLEAAGGDEDAAASDEVLSLALSPYLPLSLSLYMYVYINIDR
jgi:hypothetical protein